MIGKRKNVQSRFHVLLFLQTQYVEQLLDLLISSLQRQIFVRMDQLLLEQQGQMEHGHGHA